MNEEKERVLSVYELSTGLKETVESATAGRWVEGELGRVQRPVSGHLYFSLKDGRRDAMIDCVMYKRDAMRWGAKLIEGERVQLRGRATFYPPRGRLQWVADVAKAAGQGALLEALEKLKRKLIAEGLTAPERKRALPDEPRLVGVVTSRTGAAFSDIVTVARRRGQVRLLLAPAVVQGDGAVASILAALDLIEKASPEVVIVGRGGGSAEDLMAFNDERVVRRVAAMKMPVVSAVGHEIDFSLTDLVADARAATPSQAAEMVVPDDGARREALLRAHRHLLRATKSRVMEAQLQLNATRARMADPRFVLFEHQQGLDERRTRLFDAMKLRGSVERRKVSEHRHALATHHPRSVISRSRASLSPVRGQMQAAMRRILDRHRAQLSQAGSSLTALSPLNILGRGYALAFKDDGSAISDVSALQPEDSVTVRVRKGSFVAKVQKVVSQVENAAGFEHETQGKGVMK